MSPTRQWQLITGLSLGLVALTLVPYLVAYNVHDHAFIGALINPLDGLSYFAKMRAGWRGDWLFVLPYTHDATSPGVLVYGFYLLLGHLARWTGLSLDIVYHSARALGGVFFLLTAYAVICDVIPAARGRLSAWVVFAIGSGLGWAVAFAGGFTADLWVAEYIPFLSIFTNPHFPLAAALQLWLFKWLLLPRPKIHLERVALVTLALGFVQPLALVTVGLITAAFTGWQLLHEHRRMGQWRWPLVTPLVVLSACALPWLVYSYALTLTDPMVRAWFGQNDTPSPGFAEALIAGGLPLALAIVGGVRAARRRNEVDVALLLWAGLGVLAIYAPFALQRRLAMGLWMPMVLLAWMGWREVIQPRLGRIARLGALALGAVALVMSNTLVYISTWVAIQKRDLAIFLTLDEQAGLDWLRENAGRGVVLASPAMGLLIPARTDARVLYGHPIETVNAKLYQLVVESFFNSTVSLPNFVVEYPVDYIFFGPREQAYVPPGVTFDFTGWPACATFGETVTIYGKQCPSKP